MIASAAASTWAITFSAAAADNRYQAAIAAAAQYGDGVEVSDVRPAVGRPSTSVPKTTKKSVKKVAKKRRPLSQEARAKLAQNLVKARAARARNLKAAKQPTTRSPAKTTKRVAKKR